MTRSQWVQRLKVETASLSFEVVDGVLHVVGRLRRRRQPGVFDADFAGESLNGYRPAISLGESQVGYAGNRVQRLLLKKLRVADGRRRIA